MKFRSQDGLFYADAVRAGGKSHRMAFSELYTALQQGVVDGHINPLVTIYANGFDEVTPNITVVNLFYDLTGMYISYDRWKEMSEEQQNILIEAMGAGDPVPVRAAGRTGSRGYGGVGTILYDL